MSLHMSVRMTSHAERIINSVSENYCETFHFCKLTLLLYYFTAKKYKTDLMIIFRFTWVTGGSPKVSSFVVIK